jgi:hypothetical protein
MGLERNMGESRVSQDMRLPADFTKDVTPITF